MARIYWRQPANSNTAAQVWKGTITTTTNGHTYTVTLTDDDGSTAAITYTVTNPPDTTTTLVATGFITAWNASTNPIISRWTATQSSGQVILTADTAGVPGTFSTGGTGTWSGTGNTTSNIGNNDFNTAQNWSGDAVPTTDDLTFDAGSVGILYGLNQSGNTYSSLTIGYGCTSQFGQFLNGKPFYFRAGASAFNYYGNGTLAMFDLGSSNIAALIQAYGSPATTGRKAVYLKGSNLTTVTVNRGTVGLGSLDGDTATIATVLVGYLTNQTGDADVTIGSGVTLTTLNQTGGTAYLNCAATTATNASGSTLYTAGSGAITTVNGYGTCYLNSTGTITNLNVYGTVDLSQSKTSRTVTNCTLYPGSTLKYNSALTFTNKPVLATGSGANTATLIFVP